jgi:hypothetical protein
VSFTEVLVAPDASADAWARTGAPLQKKASANAAQKSPRDLLPNKVVVIARLDISPAAKNSQ